MFLIFGQKVTCFDHTVASIKSIDEADFTLFQLKGISTYLENSNFLQSTLLFLNNAAVSRKGFSTCTSILSLLRIETILKTCQEKPPRIHGSQSRQQFFLKYIRQISLEK